MTNLVRALTVEDIISKTPFPPGEPISGKTYIADGWVYRDFAGRMTKNVYDELIALVGLDNLVHLATSSGSGPQGVWVRGQFLVSPEGQRRIADHIAGAS